MLRSALRVLAFAAFVLLTATTLRAAEIQPTLGRLLDSADADQLLHVYVLLDSQLDGPAVHREVAGSCAKYFSLDPDTIGKMLLAVLSDRNTIDDLSGNCSATAARYNWNCSTNQLLTVFSKILS